MQKNELGAVNLASNKANAELSAKINTENQKFETQKNAPEISSNEKVASSANLKAQNELEESNMSQKTLVNENIKNDDLKDVKQSPKESLLTKQNQASLNAQNQSSFNQNSNQNSSNQGFNQSLAQNSASFAAQNSTQNANLTNSNAQTQFNTLLNQALNLDNISKENPNNTGFESLMSKSDEANVQNTDSQSPLNELNSLVKDLSRVSSNELKSQVTSPKETLQNFVQDLKEQMTQFKAPITRLNITLNPSNLGEVEVTLVQRGANLHINFNSNTNAMNLFIQNQAEFKNSLVNMGFTGLEMNFSDQSKKEQNQKNKSKNNGANNELNTLNNSEEKPSLELVLAKYF